MLEYYWRMFGPLADPRKTFLIRHGMACDYPVPDSQKQRARRSLGWAAGVSHDGRFIEKWLGVKPDLCPDQGLRPVADELPPVPEPEPNSAVYVGRLEPDTGIRIYIDAVRGLVRDHRRRFALHVYGDGTLLSELRARVERESLPVTFHGRMPYAQDHISDGCFAFVDGRMAIQEAMARRRLVLAAYVDPLKYDYVAGEPFSAYLVAVADAVELVERVAHYIDHLEERAALIGRAHEYSRQLTWTRTARAYVRFWQERLACPRLHLPLLQRAKLACKLEGEALAPHRTTGRSSGRSAVYPRPSRRFAPSST
jgi:glycosyltransferase involved in cell wall biosynthesis